MGVELLGFAPEAFTSGIVCGEFEIAKQKVGLEHRGLCRENLRASLTCLFLLTIAPEGLGKADPGIVAVRVILDYSPKFLNSLRQHLTFGIETGKA